MTAELTGAPVASDQYSVLASEWLRILEPLLKRLSSFSWSASDEDQYWHFLKLSAITRQYEALATAVKMDETQTGHFAVTLVRPAYEELVWIEYLTQHEAIACELVGLLSISEMRANLEAQNQYLGIKGMSRIGFTQRAVKIRLAAARKREARLREIGAALKWRQGATLPSFAELARQVGREKEYQFLYQGTSRFVHFSTNELFRRVWGKSGSVQIGSGTFSRYWRDFALYWLLRTLLLLINHCSYLLEESDLGNHNIEEAMRSLETLAPVQIITATELKPW